MNKSALRKFLSIFGLNRQIWISACLLFVFGLVLLESCNQKEETKVAVEVEEKSNGHIPVQECRPCHAGIVDSFLQTGKGRSFFPAIKAGKIADWNTEKPVFDKVKNLFYLAEKQKSTFSILEFRLEGKDTIHSRRELVSHVIGSGNQTVSFLREENGYLYEMPLTWYSRKKIWDLSPGYENGGNQRFDREIGTECLDCHNSGFGAIPNSINRYKNAGHALNCSSCHASANAHLEEMQKTNGKSKDLKIIRLAATDQQIQMDVCRNCHLEGIKIPRDKKPAGDFSPGKRFSDYYEVFIPSASASGFGFASHAERLQMSACFKNSKGKLTCTTCHDPHGKLPEDPETFYNEKCLSCHTETSHQKSCTKSNGKKTNCISCHLLKSGTSDIPHVNSTDHFIRKNPTDFNPKKGKTELRNFAGRSVSEVETGLAWLKYSENMADTMALQRVKSYLKFLPETEKLRYHYLKNLPGLPNADSSSFRKSSNPIVLFYWSEVKRKAGLPWYSELELACKKAPDRIDFLFRKALADEETGRIPDYEQILKRRPLDPDANTNLGYNFLNSGNHAEAEKFLKNALKGDPDRIMAKENLARCYIETGKFEEARKILNRLCVENPAENRYKEALKSLP